MVVGDLYYCWQCFDVCVGVLCCVLFVVEVECFEEFQDGFVVFFVVFVEYVGDVCVQVVFQQQLVQ